MKPSFLKYEKPLITAMIQYPTADECILKIKSSIADGADAIGIQLDKLKKEYLNKEHLTKIFEACEGKPIYVTCYREGIDLVRSDEECAEILLLALSCGATLCDVMGDMFNKTTYLELTEDVSAIEKQMRLIDEIHRCGGEVLMSCHTERSTTIEENLKIAKAQAERGADILKIVNLSESESEIPKYIEAIQKIIKLTDKKLLFLVTGEADIIRYIGPCFGVCMYLCVRHHGPFDTKSQPLIKDIKSIKESIKF